MQIFQRDLESKITAVLFKGKMVVILGPRQSGKTTLAKKIIAAYGARAVFKSVSAGRVSIG